MARKKKIPDYIKNSVPYRDKNLDEEELDILRRLESGELKSMPRKRFLREKAMLEAAARNYLAKKQTKDGRVTLRMAQEDIQGYKNFACEEGLPYQTLITSLLHKILVSRDRNGAWPRI